MIKYIIIFCLCTLSLSVFSFGGYSFTGAWLIMLISAKVFQVRVPKYYFIGYSVILLYLLINYFFHADTADASEFSKSYFQIASSPFVMCILYAHRAKLFIQKSFISMVCVSITFLFVISQVLEFQLFGTTESWFLLDSYSISTAENVARFQAVNYLDLYRPIGQYHEPSYLGLVAFMFYILNDIHPKKDWLVKILTILIMLFSVSTTIYIFFVLYFSLFNIQSRYSGFFAAIIVILALKLGTDLTMLFRLDEILTVGSSGWHRIIKPFDEFILVIQHYPFGIPVGNNSFVFDNSVFLIASYLGIFSLALIVIALYLAVTKVASRRILIFVLTCMMVSGAIITIESFLMIGFLIFSSMPPKSSKVSLNKKYYETLL